MKIVSTNIGDKKTVQYNGQEVITGIFKTPVSEPIILEKEDVIGDVVIDRRYHGGIDKACYIYSADHYEFWKSKYPELDWNWGMFGENLTISGFDESVINIGDVFQIGTAKVQITQPRQPCFKLGIRLNNPMAVTDFVKAEMPGGYIRVLEKGKVSAGDSFKLISHHENGYTLKQVFHLIYNAQNNINIVKDVIKQPELAASCRKDLIKYAKL